VPGAKSIVWGVVAVATSALLVACAAISGLDDLTTRQQACQWTCDASLPGRDDRAAPDASLSTEGGDATTADVPGDDLDAMSDGAVETSPGDAGPPDDAGAEDAGDAGDGGCQTGWLSCDGGCVAPSDPLNCGACGNACGSDGGAATCRALPDTSEYVCVPRCLPGAPTLCDGGCVDTTSDPDHCGSCGGACPTGVANSHPTCGDGGCGIACDTGLSLCSGACVPLTSATHCGGCGVGCDPDGGTPVCAPPAATDGGPFACASGCPATASSRCGGGCTNTATDLANCGGCARVCTTAVANATAVCSTGSCSYACNPPYVACGGACVDETSDLNNCGGCGVGFVCGVTQVCIARVCTNRCQKTADCPTGNACNGTTCTTACNINQACHGGCCSGGTCTTGLAGPACGTSGGACLDCSGQGNDTACVNGACGCNVASDCAALNACSTALHSCEGLCGGTNTGCNGGCCTNLASGGTCVMGNVDNQCGGTGGQCNDCQTSCNAGPRCLGNSCGCGNNIDCSLASECSGRGVCSDAGACHM
jgi:hypothetical protein